MDKFNNWLANNLSDLLSSMKFFYFCVSLVIMAIICPALAPLSTFISGTIIQLLALPILAVVSDIATNKIIKLLTETHDVAMISHDELHTKLDKICAKLEI